MREKYLSGFGQPDKQPLAGPAKRWPSSGVWLPWAEHCWPHPSAPATVPRLQLCPLCQRPFTPQKAPAAPLNLPVICSYLG